MIKQIAIIVCTYNPVSEIFQKVLNSIVGLKVPPDVEMECVIVDNNSSPGIERSNYLLELLSKNKWIKIVTEKKQGLTYARMAGIQATTSPIIVFFDDDNEPVPDYLISVMNIFSKYPQVGVCGPGIVEVEYFPTTKNKWLLKNKSIFQERNVPQEQYDTIKKWCNCYPAGTGQAMKREVAEEYARKVNLGEYSLTDRTKNNLLSGGDVQIVFTAIKKGMSAGISPTLRIKHLISSKKTNFKYILKLSYGTALSYYKAITETFPEEKENVILPSNKELAFQFIRIIITSNIRGNFKKLQIGIAAYLGDIAGRYYALGQPQPTLLRKVSKYFI
jgi:glycosyltransferase involved in cell wall biosynthesis